MYLIHAGYYTAQELLMKNLTLGTSLSTNKRKTSQEYVQSIQSSATQDNTVSWEEKQNKTKQNKSVHIYELIL